MRVIWFLATVLVCATAAHKQKSVDDSGKVRYDNCKVYNLKINNRAQLALMDFIEAKSDKYNIWKEYDEATKEIRIMVQPEEHSNFLHMLKLHNIESELMINNVQELIDEEASFSKTRSNNTDFDWTRYYELDEIEEFLDRTLAAHPNVTEGFVIGKSYENRDIRGIKISFKPGNPIVFIECNIHAREWITSATCTWLTNELLKPKTRIVRTMAESYDWHIIPVLNPDGFVYTHTKNRMWRKTRQPVNSSRCVGTDANRNFDVYWMENGGASSNPCSETFAGPKPFSEPETAALAKYVTAIKNETIIYLAFHSYSQVILSPYGNSSTVVPPNYDELQILGNAFCDAIMALPYKTKYRSGATGSLMYIATGASVDWVNDKLDIDYAFTIEMRDTGRYGFLLPPKQIVPNCEEILAGLIALLDKAEELNYF